jgi:hypothetical protein
MSKRSVEEEELSLPFKRRRSNTASSTPAVQVSSSHIGRLSDEILLAIFERLSLEQLLLCQPVSHRWHKISTDPELWKRLYFLRYVKPRLVHLRSRRHIASRDWWMTETTQDESGEKKDWKHLFKVRHNWHKGRCAISEIDISDRPSSHENLEVPRVGSFWEEVTTSTSPPLVQFDGTIFLSADKDAGLRAWNITQIENGGRKIVGSRRFRGYEEGWRLGAPSALAIDGDEANPNITVGFESGGLMILQLRPMDALNDREHGFWVRLVLPPPEIPSKILHVTFSYPYLLTLDVDNNLRAYLFEDNQLRLQMPRSLATLLAPALRGPCNLTLRRLKTGAEETVIASIAYSLPLFHGGWSVGIQEVVLDLSSADGISRTRIGTCAPTTYNLQLHPDHTTSMVRSMSTPTASPTSISYSHPYLLTSHRDNTLTLYLVRSTEKEISIGEPRRLWGHTTGVAKAGVAGRGRAVSVSQVGGEVRVWELESIASTPTKANANVQYGGVVSIVESVRVENALPSQTGKELYLDSVPVQKCAMAVEWIGFDDEKLLVVTRDHERDKNVTLYDFTF